jgi:hypothetical protein
MSSAAIEDRPRVWSRSRVRFAAGIVLVLAGGMWAAIDQPAQARRPPNDITQCKHYDCTGRYCGEFPYTHGVCVDGSQQMAITIDCCCCTGNSRNRYFIGG